MRTIPMLLITGGCIMVSMRMDAALAQSYPTRPVRIVVGFAPGGATDIAARAIAQKMAENFPHTVIVDNRPGASGNIAAELVAKSAPDGYTVFMANATIAIPSLFKSLPFDVKKDFAPVTLVANGPSALVVHPSLPAKSVRELIALAKQRPGQVNFASAGQGNITHLAMELFNLMAGINMVHLAYKGGGLAMIAVVSGEAQVGFISIAVTQPQIRQGKLRVIALSSSKRSLALPDVPTVSEAGLPGYEASSWYGLFVPSGTPKSVISNLNSGVNRSLNTSEVKDRLVSQGFEPAGGSAEDFTRYLNTEIAKWARVVKETKIFAQ